MYPQLTCEPPKNDNTMQSVVQRLRQVEESRGSEGLSYKDLYFHPDVELSEAYKPSNFEVYNKTGDPEVHLGIYCDKLARVGKNENIRMKLFMKSLTR